MDTGINLRSNLATFGFPLLIILTMVYIVKSPLFALNPVALSFGVTFDLLVTTPFIYYLFIRKRNIPKVTVVSFFLAGIAIASFILPAENQNFLSHAKTWVLPLVEITVLILVGYKFHKALQRYRDNKTLSLDFFTVLKQTCQELLPKRAAAAVATEIAMFYYGFLHWRKITPRQNEFTYHRDSGTVALLMVLIFLVLVESTLTHILLMRWSTTAAWVLTFLSVYTGFQVFGVMKSIIKRPIKIENGLLYLYYGVASEAIINTKDISSVEAFTKSVDLDNETKKLSPLGDLESHNTIIRLNTPHVLNGLYGMRKEFKTLLLHVDNRDEFVIQLKGELEKNIS